MQKLSFQLFCTRRLKYYILLKLQITFILGLNAAKNTHPKKTFEWKLFGNEFRTKKSENAYLHLPPEWSQVTRKIDMVEILYCTKPANYIHFRGQCCRKYTSHQKKKLRIKVVQNWISYKKVCERICLSSHQGGAKWCERLIWLKYYALKWRITFRHTLVCVNAYTCVCKVPSNICGV